MWGSNNTQLLKTVFSLLLLEFKDHSFLYRCWVHLDGPSSPESPISFLVTVKWGFCLQEGQVVYSAKCSRVTGYVKEKVSLACSWNMLFVKGNEIEMVGCNQWILGLGHLVNKLQTRLRFQSLRKKELLTQFSWCLRKINQIVLRKK